MFLKNIRINYWAGSTLRLQLLIWLLAAIFYSGVSKAAIAEEQNNKNGITLYEALSMALDFHPSISATKLQYQSAAGELNSARWLALPDASFIYRGFEDDGEEEILDQEILTVSQPLWTGGRVSGNISFARANRDIAKLAIVEAEQKLLEETLRAFTELRQAEANRNISLGNVEEHERLFKIIERRVKASTSPEVDLRLARARLAFSRSQFLQSKNTLEISRANLAQLIGQPVKKAAPFQAANVEKGSIEDAVKRAVSFSPRIRKMRTEISGLEAMEKVARSALYPQVSIGYEKNYGEVLSNRDDEKVFLGLDFQPGAGLSAFSSISSSKAKKLALRDNLKALELEVRQEVEVVWRSVSSAEMQLSPTRQFVNSTEEVVNSYLRQYRVGKKSWLDVLNAQRELVQARRAQVEQESKLSMSFYKMQILIGDLNRKTVMNRND